MSQHPTQPPTAPAPGPAPHVAAALARLDAAIAQLRSTPGDADLWKSAHQAIKKTRADQIRVGRAIAERNLDALADLARQARAAGDAPPKRPPAAAPPPPPSTPPTPTGATPDDAAPELPPISGAAPSHSAAPPQTAEITPDILKHALAAFKKRIKLTRLDDESRLGVGKRAMTGGRKSDVVAIIPPNQYPRAVWDELAKQGKLKRSGSGFYELVE